MSSATEVTCTAAFVYLPTLVDAARIAAAQNPLPEYTAFQITYLAKVGNATDVEFTTDPHIGIVCKSLAAGEEFIEFYDNEASLRNWHVRGDGNELIVTMQS